MATIERATEIRAFQVEVPDEDPSRTSLWQEPEIFTNELRAAFRSLR